MGERYRIRLWSIGRELVLVACVIIVAYVALSQASRQAPFHQDESNYVWMSRYFYLFIQGDVANPEWDDWYWSHTQPKLGPYIVGASLWANGYTMAQIPPYFLWQVGLAENRQLGRVPDDRMLSITRLTMVAFAVGVMVLLYGLVRVLGGPLDGAVGGIVAVLFALGSGPAHEELVQTLIESPSMCFILLTLFVGFLGAWRGRSGQLTTGWALALGLALGLALSTKLTALLCLVSIAGWGGLMVLLAVRRSRALTPLTAQGGQVISGSRSALDAAWTIGRGWALALVLAVVVFVAIDPHIWSNPPRYIADFFVAFREGVASQQQAYPDLALTEPISRARYLLWGALMGRTLSGQFGWPIEPMLVIVGASTLVWRTWLRGQRTGQPPPEGLVVLTVLAFFAGPSMSIHLAWPRYVLPTLLVGTLLSGLGAGALVQGAGIAIRLAGWRRQQAELSQAL